MEEEYKELFTIAADALANAHTIYGSRVGVALKMSDGYIYHAFNIESHGVPDIHAEVLAVSSALLSGKYKPEDFKILVIAYNFKGIYPSCLACRQFLWEHTNPDLKIVSVDPSTGKGIVTNLDKLCPFPFPIVEVIKEETKVEQPVTEKESS